MSKIVHVAAGIIYNEAGEVLLAKRPAHLHQGDLWEFPGGKVEGGETVAAALSRELKEELAIDVVAAEAFMQVRHDYSDKRVLLDFWRVMGFSGSPVGQEGQSVQWFPIGMIDQLEFPEANLPVVDAVIAYAAQTDEKSSRQFEVSVSE